MATQDYSPIVKVEWDSAGNNFAATTDIGEVKDDSEHAPELQEDNVNSRGEVMWAGYDDVYTVNAFDTSKHAALETAFKNDTRVDFRLTRDDGSTITVLDVKPKVGPVVEAGFSPGGRSQFTLTIFKFTS